MGGANTPADRAAANGAFTAAFGAWAGVMPSLIGFVPGAAAAPGTSGLTLDGHNTLNFADAALDDRQVISSTLDDVQVIASGAAAAAGAVVVAPGPDGALATAPQGDDVPCAGGICEPAAGGNGIADTTANTVPPGAVLITPGVNGVLDTQPQGDDMVMGANIVDGGNGIPESNANNQGTVLPPPPQPLALAGLFFNNSSGVLIEADIVFRGTVAYRNFMHNQVPPVAGQFDLQMIAMHEIGHFIGIAHPIETFQADDVQVIPVGNAAAAGAVVVAPGPDGALDTAPQGDDVPCAGGICEPGAGGNGTANTVANNFTFANPAPNPIMSPIFRGNPTATNQMLAAMDMDPCNFLYTPDLGDAPNLDNVALMKFSTLVHVPMGGRLLNGITLDAPAKGPLHKFGRSRRLPARNYTYEWIGTGGGSDVDAECEANILDMDLFDDGVRFNPDPPVWGEPLTITVDVRTALDAQGNGHNYVAAMGGFPLYVNLWIDLNTNGEWEEGGEHPINNVPLVLPAPGAGSASGTVTLPLTLETVWLRARLDWGEMVMPGGLGTAGLSPTLNLHEGAAQFGEDEDYPLACPPVEVWDFVWSDDPVDWGPGIWTKDGQEIGRTFPDGTSTGGTEPMHKSDHIDVPGEPNDWHWTADFDWNSQPASLLVWFENFDANDDICVVIYCSPNHLDYMLMVDISNDTYTLLDAEDPFHTDSWSGYPDNLPEEFEPTGDQRCNSEPPPMCGDGACEGGETCEDCPEDCGTCVCGNGSCDSGEHCVNCPEDCGPCPVCGDELCEEGEDCEACPEDCPCEEGEVCVDGECVNIIPTVSEWGLIVMTLLALTAGTIVFARRRRPTLA